MTCYIDFIMDLPLCNGYSDIFTCVDSLTKYCKLIPCFVHERALSAALVAKLFFDNVVRFFGVPGEVISDRDPSFCCFLLVGAVGFAGDQASNEFYLPSSDRWADREDSQDLGADFTLSIV